MSQIEELIERLCPDGVEESSLSEVIRYDQPTKYLVSSKEYNDLYSIPVLTAGKTFVLGYTNDTEGIYSASPSNPVIIFDDFTATSKWVNFPFKVKSSAMKILSAKPNSPLTLRYLYYAIQTIRYSPEAHSRQWISTFSKFKVPAPPLEVQHEIVKRLFTNEGVAG
ncbi:type I restriction endonuclease subunit R [Propionibacterium freudenreichii]|uniref:restriction endonuclease subunit S n=1 Tax=Propionibacterium freudenreichii TaxID=1744 RepID=UPI0021A538BB|nr:restriction endonuclease subunit S [Propionibacterium freudenreichii]MCT3000198.1 type I restriction endonuclease subunit R [Propionibacterium freudenreichii]